MKALTLWQPWATLIAIGAKTIETRSWGTDYRGPLAIHAAKRPMRDGEITATMTRALALAGYESLTELPMGAVVCVCDLIEVFPTAQLELPAPVEQIGVPDSEYDFGDLSPGRFGWRLANVRALAPPVRCPGARNLWDVDDSIDPRLAVAA